VPTLRPPAVLKLLWTEAVQCALGKDATSSKYLAKNLANYARLCFFYQPNLSRADAEF
jgi:hypothetical protein